MARKKQDIQRFIAKKLTPEAARNFLKKVENPQVLQEYIKKYGEERFAQILSIVNPVIWAEHNLKDPNPGALNYIRLRPQQKKVLLMDAQRKVLRWTRGGGKTVAMVCEILWKAFTMSRRIIILVPGESQADSLYLYIENMLTTKLLKRITRKRKSPYTIEIDGGPGRGGSLIRIIVLGTSSGKSGSSARSWTGDDLYLDEAQEIPPIMDAAIVPLFDRLPHVNIWVSGTPGIERNLFWRVENEKTMGFKLSHVSLRDLPEYTPELEERVKNSVEMYSFFVREFLAEWYDTQESFFPLKAIEKCKVDWDYENISPLKKSFKVFAVDWNAPSTGTVIYGFEYYFNDNEKRYKIRPFYRNIIQGERFHKRAAIETILDLIMDYPDAYWVVDKGYGEAEVEDIIYTLEKLGRVDMIERFKVIDFGKYIEINNPINPNDKLKYHLKSYIFASFRSALVDMDIFEIPTVEERKPGLLWEMRHLKIKGESSGGNLLFKGADHRIVCWAMAFFLIDEKFNITGRRKKVDEHILEYISNFREHYKRLRMGDSSRDVDFKEDIDQVSEKIRNAIRKKGINYEPYTYPEDMNVKLPKRKKRRYPRIFKKFKIIKRDFFDE